MIIDIDTWIMTPEEIKTETKTAYYERAFQMQYADAFRDLLFKIYGTILQEGDWLSMYFNGSLSVLSKIVEVLEAKGYEVQYSILTETFSFRESPPVGNRLFIGWKTGLLKEKTKPCTNAS